MRIVISTDGKDLKSMVDQRFGRCRYFLVVETDGKEVKEVKAVENKGAVQGHGAGIAAAQQVGELKADKIITGNLGPNATQVLEELGIESYQGSGQAQKAVDELIEGKLNRISQTAESHAGMAKNTDKTGERVFFPLLED
ncbi:MAG: NifB/NifX family molybdenum-iron cluster-binding protein, partial [Nanoarchaeota archaeon]|nr:NifB/NifX family molybdenum-iron cluster-binding protein [Nanoarchaeota archaeon]